MERDEMNISHTKTAAINSVQPWIRKLVDLGASPDEISDTIKQIENMALITASQRKVSNS